MNTAMKISIALSALILAIGTLPILKNHQNLTELRIRKSRLVSQAAALHLTVDPSNPKSKLPFTSHLRSPKPEISDESKRLAAKLLQLMREVQEDEKTNSDTPEQKAQAMQLLAAITKLSPTEVKYLIGEIQNAGDIKDEMKTGLSAMALALLSENHPRAALAVIADPTNSFASKGMMSEIVSTALSHLAEEDPMAAMTWFKQNTETLPKELRGNADLSIITGAAKRDPRLALQLMKDVDPERQPLAATSIAQSAKTPEERTAALDAMRNFLSTTDDDDRSQQIRGAFISSIGSSLAADSFESASVWIDGAGFTSEENALIAGGLQYTNTKQESGEWISWMASHLPGEHLGGQVENMVSQWTQSDYQAAGKWLQQAPDDAAKVPAVAAYAKTVAPYEPATAEQWALTLPAGEVRKQTLTTIRDQWPADDPDGKAAFSKRNGLE